MQKQSKKEHVGATLLSIIKKMAAAGRQLAATSRTADAALHAVPVANDQEAEREPDELEHDSEIDTPEEESKTKEQKKSKKEEKKNRETVVNRSIEKNNRWITQARQDIAAGRRGPRGRRPVQDSIQQNITALVDEKENKNFTQRLAEQQQQELSGHSR